MSDTYVYRVIVPAELCGEALDMYLRASLRGWFGPDFVIYPDPPVPEPPHQVCMGRVRRLDTTPKAIDK